MRVISGLYKNHPLLFPKNIRPYSQKHKKIVFDILRFDIQDSLLLDFFAGSGQMGIEAISNGAKKVAFVDLETNLITDNISRLKIPDSKYQIFKQDYLSFILHYSSQFDIIIADPPHLTIDWSSFSNISKLGHAHSIFVLKYSPHHHPPAFSDWNLAKQKIFSDNIIDFYIKSK